MHWLQSHFTTQQLSDALFIVAFLCGVAITQGAHMVTDVLQEGNRIQARARTRARHVRRLSGGHR